MLYIISKKRANFVQVDDFIITFLYFLMLQ